MRVFTMFMVLATPSTAAPLADPHLQQGGQARKTEGPGSNPQPQSAFRRLFLKDGSSQPITRYAIRGNRVRYFSSERHEWEEVPSSIVDWPATVKYAQETAAARQVRSTQHTEGDAQERAEEEARTPLVAPGLRLPDTGGVFLRDSFKGKTELNQLRQNGANINKNTAGNILRGAINPIASTKRTIELAGLHAQVQSHVADPVIYVGLDSGGDPAANYAPETSKDHFRIVRCEQKKGDRIVGVINIAVYGKVKQDAAYVATKVEPVSRNWVKVTAVTPMPPGEYALVELLGKEGINTLVWDFGVNASAPENVGARKEEPVKADEAPVLQKRKKPAEP